MRPGGHPPICGRTPPWESKRTMSDRAPTHSETARTLERLLRDEPDPGDHHVFSVARSRGRYRHPRAIPVGHRKTLRVAAAPPAPIELPAEQLARRPAGEQANPAHAPRERDRAKQAGRRAMSPTAVARS